LTVEEAIAHAAAVGVTRIVQIGCDVPGAHWAVETAEQHDALIARATVREDLVSGVANLLNGCGSAPP
jgi:TatD DNase family protein